MRHAHETNFHTSDVRMPVLIACVGDAPEHYEEERLQSAADQEFPGAAEVFFSANQSNPFIGCPLGSTPQKELNGKEVTGSWLSADNRRF